MHACMYVCMCIYLQVYVCVYTHIGAIKTERERESGRDRLFSCLGVLVWVVYVVLLSCGLRLLGKMWSVHGFRVWGFRASG